MKDLFLTHVGQTSDMPLMMEVERAEGIYFYGPDGKKYTDLISGVTVCNTGHANKKVIDAVCQQAQKYMHVMVYGEVIESPQVKYAVALANELPEKLSTVYFVNSGSEAIEGALKLSKRWTGRSELISCRNAYHGSTHGAISMMGGETFREAFRPLLPDVRQIRYDSIEDLQYITTRTAAVLIEPIQGEGGVRVPSEEWIRALRARCTEVGALLIYDEVQTAFGRTGNLWGWQRVGVVPDVMCLAKALGGGMPLGAFVSSSEIMDCLKRNPVLGHITTFGGHPVCCAAGLASFEYLLESGLHLKADEKGEQFVQRLKNIKGLKEIRRVGLLLALDWGSVEMCNRVVKKLTDAGMLTESYLFAPESMRISPSLTITSEEIDSVCDEFISILSEL
jgi:acetylornithine/succinyldiaminopimelate/putrescine aminotransferase